MNHRPARRGVLLLIVLSLLVLFALIGVTFIVVAGQYNNIARANSRHELKGDPPPKELDGALMQLLRGSMDSQDLMFRHNLLRDLYGSDGFEGTLLSASIAGPGGQQFLELQFADPTGAARPFSHHYAGSVITLLDGHGAGHSARIVRYLAPTLVNGVRAGTIYVAAFDDLPPAFVPAPSTRFLVNGKQFNGSGDGYDPMTGELDDHRVFPYGPAAQFETALMPFAQPPQSYGDSDESWDAADYQNVFLARIPSQIPLSGIADFKSDPLIPSFHQPYLVNYWMHRLKAMGPEVEWGTSDARFVRRFVVARPMPDEHPFFTGSNPKFVLSPLLDRDADGVP